MLLFSNYIFSTLFFVNHTNMHYMITIAYLLHVNLDSDCDVSFNSA